LTNPVSFNHITRWVADIHQHTSADLPILLIGNKSDLVDERKVSREQATNLAKQLNIPYMETSALNASNVEQAFMSLVTSIYQKKKLQSVGPSSDRISIEEPTVPKKSGCC
jgi:Ras-related protein Rab-11A